MKTPLRWLRRVLQRSPGDLDPGLAQRNASYDAQALAVMERVLRRDSSCVDVGCHRGTVLADMLRLAPEGRHFAFEPIPRLYRDLVRRYRRRPGVVIYPIALSDAAGRATFQHVVSNPAYSGLRKRRYDRPEERVEQIEVETDRLDHVLPADTPIHLIKIDVEGAELGVLRGAVKTLRQWQPVVVFEHGLGGADYYGTAPEDVHALLAGECGLRLHLMERWLRGEPALEASEFAERFRQGLDYYFMAKADEP